MGMVCTTLPTERFARLRHFLPRLPGLQWAFFGSTRTIRMSFAPRPAESVQRNRPLRVRPPPVGRLPSSVVLPTGCSFRPEGWMWVAGPISPAVLPPPAARTTVTAATAMTAPISAA